MPAPLASAIARTAAAAMSRRSSLLTLGGAGLAALARPASAAAGKTGKKARARCRRQVAGCRAALRRLCERSAADVAACEANVFPCCDPLARCDADPAIACVVSKL